VNRSSSAVTFFDTVLLTLVAGGLVTRNSAFSLGFFGRCRRFLCVADGIALPWQFPVSEASQALQALLTHHCVYVVAGK